MARLTLRCDDGISPNTTNGTIIASEDLTAFPEGATGVIVNDGSFDFDMVNPAGPIMILGTAAYPVAILEAKRSGEPRTVTLDILIP